MGKKRKNPNVRKMSKEAWEKLALLEGIEKEVRRSFFQNNKLTEHQLRREWWYLIANS